MQERRSLIKPTSSLIPVAKHIDSLQHIANPRLGQMYRYARCQGGGKCYKCTPSRGPHHKPRSVVSVVETWSICGETLQVKMESVDCELLGLRRESLGRVDSSV